MRRALTLIELVLTMVIVGLVFTVVPRIVFVTNKSLETVIKEEALFNAVALAEIVTRLPWDEGNTDHDQILPVAAGAAAYRCDASSGYYRIGGFRGSRNCIDADTLALSASAVLGREGSRFDDLDDYNGFVVDAATPTRAKYRLRVSVRYLADPPAGAVVDLSALAPSSRSTNLKEVEIAVSNAPGNAKAPFTSTLRYHAANLGLVRVHRRAWR